ncbi:MAG: hypothetical protein B7X64_03105 [Halothiobacillus sp. 39-53-45]|nr:MAG: hypothetical protein B7X64_03105 [Halothiobacillus sp. 39-53-45]
MASPADQEAGGAEMNASFQGFEAVAGRFRYAKITGKTARAAGDCHQSTNSRSRPVALREMPDGSIQVTCFAGCAHADILKSVGLHYTDLLPDHLRHSRSSHVKPKFEGWPCLQTLDALMVEINVVRICANRQAEGGTLTADDHKALRRAHHVLNEAVKRVSREVRHG